MTKANSLLMILFLAAVSLAGCGSEPAPAPTGATREEAIEKHQELSNFEMQSIEKSRSDN